MLVLTRKIGSWQNRARAGHFAQAATQTLSILCQKLVIIRLIVSFHFDQSLSSEHNCFFVKPFVCAEVVSFRYP